MDNKFKILGIRFGLDPILGLIPGLGDVLPLLLGFYLIGVGQKRRLPENKIRQMWVNLIVDTLAGIVPVVGDVTDFFFKSYERNFRILEEHQKGGRIVEGEIVN